MRHLRARTGLNYSSSVLAPDYYLSRDMTPRQTRLKKKKKKLSRKHKREGVLPVSRTRLRSVLIATRINEIRATLARPWDK